MNRIVYYFLSINFFSYANTSSLTLQTVYNYNMLGVVFQKNTESNKPKQVLRSTILSSTIHFALVRLISDLVRLSISQTKH